MLIVYTYFTRVHLFIYFIIEHKSYALFECEQTLGKMSFYLFPIYVISSVDNKLLLVVSSKKLIVPVGHTLKYIVTTDIRKKHTPKALIV